MPRLGPDGGASIAAYIRDSEEGSNGSVLDIRLLVRSRDGFCGHAKGSFDFCSISFAGIGSTPFVRAHRLGEILAAWKSGPATPLGGSGDGPHRAHRFPFAGRDHSHQVALVHHFGSGESLLVDLAYRDESRAHGWRPHHAGVQHPG